MTDEADRYRLSPEQHERIFQRDIVSELAAPARGVDAPRAVILGGQPGAGKSALQSAVERDFASFGGVLAIIGDDLRAYHPKYRTLLRADDKRAAFYTDRDSALWIEKLIDYAKTRRFNLLIESTMRRADKIVATASALREQGYSVEARALAVDARWSVLGIHQRYEGMLQVHGRARFTLQAAHDAAYTGMLQTLSELESASASPLDRLAIYTRGNVVIYDNRRRASGWIREPKARQAVEAERARPWSEFEKVEFLRGWQRLFDQRRARQAADEDLRYARGWRDRALLDVHADPAARSELAKGLTQAQLRALERTTAAAAFQLLTEAEALRVFPALEPYYRERNHSRTPAPELVARLSARIARDFPKPPARQRSPER
ncbi:MAG TPA: zeta toxin family protein [Polyangiales bacterium]|nr:zeta toxin family protein [Polyangiales bacterium]